MNKIILITGTSRGFGFDLANYYLDSGYCVIGCSRSDSKISHDNYIHFIVDVTSEVDVIKFAREVKKRFGGIDYLVCNVGVVKLGGVVLSTNLNSFNEFVNGILTSTFLVCREFVKIMLQRRSGKIVNISSIMTEIGPPGTCAYSSAKAAVVQFTKVLAREVAPYNITCNVLSPSLIKTDASSAFGDSWESNMLDMQTIKKPMSSLDLAKLVDFLISPSSDYITGQVIHTCFVD